MAEELDSKRTGAVYTPPPPGPLAIVYEDEALLVVNKPSGLLSVPGRGPDKADCLASRVYAEFADARVVHRLDMETSGIMIFARSPEAQKNLGRQFENRLIYKRYIAFVYGKLNSEQGVIAAPLCVDWPNRPLQKIDLEHGKSAHTEYQLLSYDAVNDVSYVQLIPLTGRSHQLRVHMCYLGHPIVGDLLYAQEKLDGSESRLLLHATELICEHPVYKRKVRFYIPAEFSL